MPGMLFPGLLPNYFVGFVFTIRSDQATEFAISDMLCASVALVDGVAQTRSENVNPNTWLGVHVAYWNVKTLVHGQSVHYHACILQLWN